MGGALDRNSDDDRATSIFQIELKVRSNRAYVKPSLPL